MTIQTGAEAQTEILSKKINIDIFHNQMVEKSQMLRDTLQELSKAKENNVSNKKADKKIDDFIEQLKLQINDLERL